MNGEQDTPYTDKDSALRRILEESPLSNTTFTVTTDIPDDDSHKHNRVRATKTYKRRSRKDKEKDLKAYGVRDVARLLQEEREALKLRTLLEQTAERLQSESKRASDAEIRAREAETRMLEVLNATRDTQRDVLRDREVLRAYQSQVEAAKNEIQKAQKELDNLAEEKYKAEQEAAKERSKYRQLQKEVEVKQALERGRMEGFVDGRKEGWNLGKEFSRGTGRTWRDAEYYSEPEDDSASIVTSGSAGPPPLTGPPFGPFGSNGQATAATQPSQTSVTMPVPDIRSDNPPVTRNLPRSMTPHSHSHRRVASAMQSPKSRTSGKSHRRSSLSVSMPVPQPAPGPGPSGLRQNTFSTEDDNQSVRSPRVFSTKTPLQPSSRHSSVRAPSTRPDVVPPRAKTPFNAVPVPVPSSPAPSQSNRQSFQQQQVHPSQSSEFTQPPQQPNPSFDVPPSQDLPPIRPIPSPRPQTPSHSPIAPLPTGFIPVLENGRISLPPPHEVDPYPPSPSAPPLDTLPPHQHTQSSPFRPPLDMNPNINGSSPVHINPAIQTQQPIESFNFPVPNPDLDPPPQPPAQDFTVPVPNSPWHQSQRSFGGGTGGPELGFPSSSPVGRSSPRVEQRRSPRSPVMGMPVRNSPMQDLNDQFNNTNLAADLFEPDENGQMAGTEGYNPSQGTGYRRPLSAIPEGGSTTAESPKYGSRNASAASFRGQMPKTSQYPLGGGGGGGSSFFNKPQPPIPPRSPMMGHSPVSPYNTLPNGLGLPGNDAIYNDPREYEDLMDLSNVSPSRRGLAEYLRPAPPDVEQIRDDVSIRTSTSKASGRDRMSGSRRIPSRHVERLEKHAELYDNFGSGRPYPVFGSSGSSRESPATPRASRTPAARRSPPLVEVNIPMVTVLEPSPPKPAPRSYRSPSRASSSRHSVVSIRSVDNAPFIPPSPGQFPEPPLQDFRIVKNSPVPPGFVPINNNNTQYTPSGAPQSRMPTGGRVPATLPDRTPAMGGVGFGGSASGGAFPHANASFNFGSGTTPMRTALPFSVSSTVRNLPGATGVGAGGSGTQNASSSIRATPARLPVNMNMNSTTTSARRLPATLPSRGTGRTIPNELPQMGERMSFGGATNLNDPPVGFVPQPSPAMSAQPMGFMPGGSTPFTGQGTFMGRTPVNPGGGLPNATPATVSNAAFFNTGSVREPVQHSTTKEPARLPGSRRASISAASAVGKTPARLPTFMGGESSQGPQATPAQSFQFQQYDFGAGGQTAPAGFVPSESNAFRPTPASSFRVMSSARPPARLPNQNSTINTPARLPLPPSNANTPWMTGAPLTNSRGPAKLPTPSMSAQQPFVPPNPTIQAVPTPGRMGYNLPGSGSPMMSSSPYQGAGNFMFQPVHSRPPSRAGSNGSARPRDYLIPPGGQVTEFVRPTIESASDDD